MNSLKVTCFVLIIITISNISALNILGIFPYPGKSHFIVFNVLLQELASRGHNLTVISHFPATDPPANYHDISLGGNKSLMQDIIPLEDLGVTSLIFAGMYLTSTGRENCDLMLANSQVPDLVKKKQNFDVIIVEHFNSDCALGVAYKLGAPVVAVTSHILMPWHFDRFGIPYNPSFVNFHFLGSGTRPSLFKKIESILWDKYFRIAYYFLTQRYNQASLEKYFGEIPPLEDLGREVKLLLLYQHYSLTGSSLFPSNVIEVGGYHIPKAKPLTGELKKFVDEAEVGIIYISFGSMVKVSSMKEEQLRAVLEAIATFPHRFIWRCDDTSIDKPPFSNLPEHLKSILTDKNKLYTSNWLPQVDILGHPKTVAFFSHGGMGGTGEALNFGVPMVAMPIIGDQPANAAAIRESGLGIQIDVGNLNKDNIVAALEQVLDPKFHERAKLLSKVWHDRPLSPMDTAIYWIEYAARNSNFTFRTAAADLPLYQYLNLDVVGVFIIFIVVMFFIVKISISLCLFCKKTKHTKTQSKKKQK